MAPAGAQTEVILYVPDENWEHYKQIIGKSQSVTLSVDDINATYADLKAKGVEFASEPDIQPWGSYATLIDSEGNSILLVQESKG